MIVWKVSIDGVACTFNCFKEAYSVYKEEKKGEFYWFSSIDIYPTFMFKKTFLNLKEFQGW